MINIELSPLFSYLDHIDPGEDRAECLRELKFFVLYSLDKKLAKLIKEGIKGNKNPYNSKLCYYLGLTSKYPNKTFNVVRSVSPPDIDIDFDAKRRDEIKEYVRKRFKEENVADIVAYDTFKVKSIFKGLVRILTGTKFYGLSNSLSVNMLAEIDKNFIEYVPQIPKLKEFIKEVIKDSSLTFVEFCMAIDKITGSISSESTHAGGIIIADFPLYKLVPVAKNRHEKLQTQVDKNDCESGFGLCKIDLLSVTTLSVISRMCKKLHINIMKKIGTMDDPKVYDTICGNTMAGLFQIERPDMAKAIKQVSPSSLEEISDVLAFHRPGPMIAGVEEKYIARKNKLEPIDYDHPDLEKYLRGTYGLCIYQEQIIDICRIAKLSDQEADKIRHACGKKIASEMEEMKEILVSSLVKNAKWVKSDAEHIWDIIEGFSGYAFNKSHSVSYAIITYMTAWLKTYYPEIFIAYFMDYVSEDKSGEAGDAKISRFLDECKALNIKVHHPDINYSEYGFTPKPGNIYYGISSIKGIGASAANKLLENKRKYSNLIDFVQSGVCTRGVAITLAKSGAFDNLVLVKDYKRSNAIEMIIYLFDLYNRNKTRKNKLEVNLDNFVLSHKLSNIEVLKMEVETMGRAISFDPLSCFIFTGQDYDSISPGYMVTYSGIVNSVSSDRSKKGNPYSRFTIEGVSGSVNCLLVGKDVVSKYRGLIICGTGIEVRGRATLEENFTIMVTEICVLEAR